MDNTQAASVSRKKQMLFVLGGIFMMVIGFLAMVISVYTYLVKP